MILAFKEQFVQPICDGTKIHTIREDYLGRWKPTMLIHFWKSNPRVLSQKPYQFHPESYPNWKGSNPPRCGVPQRIFIQFKREFTAVIRIEDRTLSDVEMETLAKNDGFESLKDMLHWFWPLVEKTGVFSGRIIHWTDFKY
jgi:hypothetical protein